MESLIAQHIIIIYYASTFLVEWMNYAVVTEAKAVYREVGETWRGAGWGGLKFIRVVVLRVIPNIKSYLGNTSNCSQWVMLI